MHRFWLSWYTFVLHTLMFFMACGGHAFASRPVANEPCSIARAQDVTVAFVKEERHHDGHSGAHLLGELDRVEEIEECDRSDKLDAFSSMPPSELFWHTAFYASYVIERQRGRAPPRLFTLITASPASLWFATTRPSRGPPLHVFA